MRGAERRLRVLRAGPLTTVQDRGRRGLAHLGVPRAGPLDAPAAALANRLLGNPADAAVLEVTLGGLVAVPEVDGGCWMAVTGAPGPVLVAGRPRAHGRAVWVPAGAELRLGTPPAGVRRYLAVAGGIAVEPVLGSRSTDTLAGVGPPPVTDGVTLPLGDPSPGGPAPYDVPRPAPSGPLRLRPGPRADWFASDAVARLCATTWAVTAQSNRVGLRLDGPALTRVRDGELASEGMVLGAVQVPPDGRPVVFLADHPPTGGYPVLGVVDVADLWRCAQLRPGETVRFARAAPDPGVPGD